MQAVTDRQVRKLMEELTKEDNLNKASMKAGMSRNTGRKYRKAGKLPSQLKQEHDRDWRTHEDAFEADWPSIELRLDDAPELEAKALFEYLMTSNYEKAEQLRREGRAEEADAIAQYDPGQVRTFQRRVKVWRATKGPEKIVFFPQEHRPGEAMQTDFTWATELEVTIVSELLEHMFCHSVLPYSNWEGATLCRSESFSAMSCGVQNHVFRLGRVPKYHQTDRSSAATHTVDDKGVFNKDYAAMIRHLGMEPRTIGVGASEQNGDIEAQNGVLKRRLKQHLLLRGSNDFESIEEYQQFVNAVLVKANALRRKKIVEELEHMRPLQVSRLPDYRELDVGVAKWSTVRVKNNTYSVPSRLIGERVRVRIYDDRLEVWYGQQLQLTVDRLLGRNGHQINYRHIIWSLVRKPGAFLRYRYREALFPSLAFRRTYDRLEEEHGSGRRADLEYLRILHLAASTMESDVEVALDLLLESKQRFDVEAVKSVVGVAEPIDVPILRIPEVDLTTYDQLLSAGVMEGVP